VDIAGGFGELAVRFDSAKLAGVAGHGARFEESRGPKPFVDADAVHDVIVA
jgi:hypothetical protein